MQNLGEVNCLPKLETVKKVNSKVFSSNLINSMNCNPYKSHIVRNFEELEYLILILSIMVGIFISKIFVPMLPYPKYRSIAYA